MHIATFLDEMEQLAPVHLADEEDRVRIGRVVEGVDEVRNVCCALDATPAAIERARTLDSTMLIVHHTPFYEPITLFQGYTARLLRPLFTNNMNLFVMHTNFDRAPNGVNRTLASLLGMSNCEEMPMGIIGSIRDPLTTIKKKIGSPLRVIGSVPPRSRLAVVGGSGFDPVLIAFAAHQGADAFLSAELKHHVALRTPMPLIESTHYNLEAPAMRRLAHDHGWVFIETSPEYSDRR
ncbi:MAG: Nif3-like dinuclear metal center hexameric protein [Methanomicrobiales archaeon]|nr:Nif3-like dinuclear metal center hexameric protein [Methanomicrobiales archaeon]